MMSTTLMVVVFYSKKAAPVLAGAAGGMSLLELVSDNTLLAMMARPFGLILCVMY